ncbi:hypothetical protein [Pseudonocardia sp. ICBG1034]|uniref:hypothetical protein n=1 Tax=Pseudonocardia sp. ICBG1034 TaxID=2844381 RepID=UPI001CCEB5D3|nr:hypothetical protein [Pseudonocardia sp. ICBG1034]
MTGPAARVLAGDADDAELARIAARAGDDLLAELAGVLTSTYDDVEAARRAAVAVTRFAAFLSPPHREPTAAAAALRLAELDGDDGDLDGARTRAEHVAGRLDPDVHPEQAARAQILLGLIAQAQDRDGAAVAHWDRAGELWETAGDPSSAAAAAASAANLLTSLPDPAARPGAVELRDRWTTACELFARAGELDDARICGTNASVYAIDVLKVAGGRWDPRRLRDDALAARAFARRHGADQEAVHLLFFVTVATADLSAPMAEIRGWAATARAEYDALDHDPAVVAGWRARFDFAEGNAALTLGDAVSAEAPLRRALAQAVHDGDEELADTVRSQLLSIVYAGDPRGDERAAALLRETGGRGLDRDATASHMAEVLAREAGDEAGADRLHRCTLALLRDAGEPIKALVVDLEHAMWLLRRGSPLPARSALAAARLCLDDPPPGAGHGMLRWLGMTVVTARVALAEHAGDRPGSLAGLAELESLQLAAGSGVLAARTAVHRARMLFDDGETARAYDVALPAALALDAVRFTLPDAGRRRRWAGIAAEGFALACRSAAALGYVRQLGELLEVVRGASLPEPSTEPADSLDELLAHVGQDPQQGDHGRRGGSAEAAGSGAVPAGAGRTALGLPVQLRTPWGSAALAEPLERARSYLDPVRADTVVDWSVPALSAGRSAAAGG